MSTDDARADVTRLLGRIEGGDESAVAQLFPLVHEQLHRLAEAAFKGRADHTLQPTALVHDVYLKLVGGGAEWDGRRHFFVVAARAMRQMLIDYARSRRADKRGGQWQRVSLTESLDGGAEEADLIRLDEALSKLSKLSERQSRIVELRFFVGLGVEEVAELLDVSQATVKNDWRAARAFLSLEMSRA